MFYSFQILVLKMNCQEIARLRVFGVPRGRPGRDKGAMCLGASSAKGLAHGMSAHTPRRKSPHVPHEQERQIIPPLLFSKA